MPWTTWARSSHHIESSAVLRGIENGGNSVALKLTTKQGIEIEADGEYAKLVTLKSEKHNIDIQFALDDQEINDLVYMLRGY